MIAKVGQAGGVCEGLDPVIKIIKHGILKYVCILIPVGLILFGLGDLGKAVIASDEKEVKAAQSRLIKRVVYAILVFLVPQLVTLVMNVVAIGADKDDQSINKIKNLNKNKYLNKHIILLINYDDINDEIKKKLNNNKLNYFIYASKNTIINEIDNKERYLISKDYYSNHKEVIDEKIKEKVEIIIEAFDGLVLDRNIAEES